MCTIKDFSVFIAIYVSKSFCFDLLFLLEFYYLLLLLFVLQVMIYIIDRVMPPHYFSRNLHSLLADIEVFHGLMQAHLPKLYAHLLQLRLRDDGVSDARESYEPPLINVFTIQWFLTLFAVCLPLDCVLRLWDSILLEGSEVILCAGLSIWKLISP